MDSAPNRLGAPARSGPGQGWSARFSFPPTQGRMAEQASGGTQQEQQGDGGAPGAAAAGAAVTESALQRVLAKHGNDAEGAKRLGRLLLKERAQDRARIEALDRKQRELQTALDQYKALGSLEDVKAKLGKVDALTQQAAARDKADADRKTARAAGTALNWDGELLADFIADKKLPVEMREAEVDVPGRPGVKEKKLLPHVVTGEGTQQKVELLTAVVDRDFPKYRAALAAKPATGTGSTGSTGGTGAAAGASGATGTTGTTSSTSGVTYPAQSTHAAGGSTQPAAGGVDDYLHKNAERAKGPNALRPAPASAGAR